MARVYDDIISVILRRIDEMEREGTGFYWVKPWSGGATLPTSYLTNHPYSGINVVLLEAGEYLTRKQIQRVGGVLKPVAVPRPVYFYGRVEKHKDNGDEDFYYFLRQYIVFHIDDVDGVESRFPAEVVQHDSNYFEADKAIQVFGERTGLTLDCVRNTQHCFYSPKRNLVRYPEKSSFISEYGYYSAIFHELIHSTARALKRRLNRSEYSKEELVAQIGSQILLNIFKIIPEEGDLDNDINYVRGWASYLKEHKSAIVSASNKAKKAANYFLNIVSEECLL